MSDALLAVEELVKHFTTRSRGGLRSKGVVKAVDGVSFTLRRGETLALVGESGSGKSTLARCTTRLIEPTSGRVTFDGRDVMALNRSQLRALRSEITMIFQNPLGSLDPRQRVGSIVGEPLTIRGEDRAVVQRRVAELLELVGLSPEHVNRYAHEFSGGQCQRIGIARALAVDPALIVCDEPVSALDVSVQAQILNLLADLQHDLGLTYLFITHDLSVVRQTADRVLVMNRGRAVESGTCDDLFNNPQDPYTARLLAAVPLPDPSRRLAAG